MTNRVAVSLAPADTDDCLQTLGELKSVVGLAEIRLDLMESFDLARLIAEAPCPLVITCRPTREGGRFRGPESERLNILTRAIELGAAYVDVEWDCVTELKERPRTDTKLIASRHWYDRMPATLLPEFESLRREADAVKLVGHAAGPLDVLPIFELLKNADLPVVAIAMGSAGQLTRLLAPCFDNCLLTYGAARAATAPGQLTVREMTEVYRLHEAGPHTPIHVHLCAGADSARGVVEQNYLAASGRQVHAAVTVPRELACELAAGLLTFVPRLTLTADSEIETSLVAQERDKSYRFADRQARL